MRHIEESDEGYSNSPTTKTPNHEELVKSSRQKASRYYLEPFNGVGATCSRGYMSNKLLPSKCEFCASKNYICLGASCMGKGVTGVETGKIIQCESRSDAIPGLLYKTLVSPLARNPGPKTHQVCNPVRRSPPQRRRRYHPKTIPEKESRKGKKVYILYVHLHIVSYLFQRTRVSGVKKVLIENAANIQMSWKEWRQILFRRRKVRKIETESSAGFKVISEKKEVDIKPDPPAEVPCGWRVLKQTDSSRMMVRKKNRPKGGRSWSVPCTSLQNPEGPSAVAENDVVKPSDMNILPDSQWVELSPPAATNVVVGSVELEKILLHFGIQGYREGLPILVFFNSSKLAMRTCTVLGKELRNTAIGEKRNQMMSLANRLGDSKLKILVIEHGTKEAGSCSDLSPYFPLGEEMKRKRSACAGFETVRQ